MNQNVPEANRTLAKAVNEEALHNPDSPYAGKAVAIVDGHVALVADNLREVIEKLREMEIDLDKAVFFEAGREYEQPQAIWECA